MTDTNKSVAEYIKETRLTNSNMGNPNLLFEIISVHDEWFSGSLEPNSIMAQNLRSFNPGTHRCYIQGTVMGESAGYTNIALDLVLIETKNFNNPPGQPAVDEENPLKY